MTDPSQYAPQPGDWDLPPEWDSLLDGVDRALVTEGELEGVPLPAMLQAVNDFTPAYEMVSAGATVEEIAELVDTVQDQWDERYPGAPMLDRSRFGVAMRLIDHGRADDAVEIANRLISPYLLVDVISRLDEEVAEDFDTSVLFSKMQGDGGPERLLGISRAVRDNFIEGCVNRDQVAAFDEMLVNAGVEEDPISGWLASRRLAQPRRDWGTAEDFLSHSEYWTDDVDPFDRRVAALTLVDGVTALREAHDNLNTETTSLVRIIDSFEDRFAEAEVWHQMRATLSLLAYAKEYPDLGQRIALSIRDSRYIVSVVLQLQQTEQEREAIELATHIPNARLAVTTLLDGGWTDELAGSTQLSEMLADRDSPVERRIALMETVRDITFDNGDIRRAEVWQGRIDDLREQE